jgi:uroporphyrinogen-III synthase
MSTGQIYLLSTALLPAGLIAGLIAGTDNIRIDALPFIRTEPIPGPTTPTPKKTPIVVTSINAIHAIPPATPPDRIYCTNGVTADEIAKRFGETSIAAKAPSAADLATLIRDREAGRTKEIVFLCGDKHRDDLPAILRHSGFIVTEEIVYKTQLTPKKIDRRYDGIAFFSPSAAESFFTLNTIPANTQLFAIGPTTAAAISIHCQNPVITTDHPDKEKLIRKMIDHFQKKR